MKTSAKRVVVLDLALPAPPVVEPSIDFFLKICVTCYPIECQQPISRLRGRYVQTRGGIQAEIVHEPGLVCNT